MYYWNSQLANLLIYGYDYFTNSFDLLIDLIQIFYITYYIQNDTEEKTSE